MKKIILIGMKGCGKTTVGKQLAKRLKVDFIDSDEEIEKLHHANKGENLSFREIFMKYGDRYFNILDRKSLLNINRLYKDSNFVFACAGRTPLDIMNQKVLKKMGKIIYLKPEKEVLYERIIKNGIPAFFPYPQDPKRSFEELTSQRDQIYRGIADITCDCGRKTPEEIIKLIEKI